MNKITLFIYFLFSSCIVFAQFTVDLRVDQVSVSNFCDADSDFLLLGDSDAQWYMDVSDNREETADFDHEITSNGPTVTVTSSSGFDNPLDFNVTYTDICPPNFLTIDFGACDDDDGFTCGGNDDLFANLVTTLPIPTTAGVTNPSISISVVDADCISPSPSGATIEYTFDLTLTITGSPAYLCSDDPCTAAVQPIQDGCGGVPLDTTRYDVSTSTLTLSSTFFAGECPAGNGGGSNDIFFQFVAPPSGEILLDMPDFNDFQFFGFANVTLNLLEGTCTGLTKVDTEEYLSTNLTNPESAVCMDLSGGLTNANYGPFYLLGLTPGQTYFLRATEDNDDSAFMDLSFQAIVANDACANAFELTGSGPLAACNFNGTNRDEPSTTAWTGGAHTGLFVGSMVQTCTGWFSNENMVWFYFDVDANTPQPITVTVDNANCTGGAGDLQMGIWYQGTAPSCDIDNHVPVGCDTGTGLLSVTLPNGVPNGRYYLGIDGNSGSQCTFEIDSPQIFTNCMATDYVSGPVASGVYQTSTSIGSDGTVGATENVSYLSDCINLDPDFEVVSGGEFLADPVPCTPFTGNVFNNLQSDENTTTKNKKKP